MTSKPKSMTEWSFCEACNSNHRHGKRHFFENTHCANARIFLQKEKRKLDEAKFFLDAPGLKRLDHLEAQPKFWCGFCQMEIDNHLPIARFAFFAFFFCHLSL